MIKSKRDVDFELMSRKTWFIKSLKLPVAIKNIVAMPNGIAAPIITRQNVFNIFFSSLQYLNNNSNKEKIIKPSIKRKTK